jgi:centromere protein C
MDVSEEVSGPKSVAGSPAIQTAEAPGPRRSPRKSFAPLQFWRGERVLYNEDSVVDDATIRGAKKQKFLVPTTGEVVRVQETELKKVKKAAGRKRHKTSSPSSKSKRIYLFDPDLAADWEKEDGLLSGELMVWGVAEAGIEPETTVQDIAISGKTIEDDLGQRGRSSGGFRYVKTAETPFFHAGVLDVPPKASKPPKNSRESHVCFVVMSGKVDVTIEETRFAISQGGSFQVPRGKFDSLSLYLYQHEKAHPRKTERVRVTQ